MIGTTEYISIYKTSYGGVDCHIHSTSIGFHLIVGDQDLGYMETVPEAAMAASQVLKRMKHMLSNDDADLDDIADFEKWTEFKAKKLDVRPTA